MSAARLALMTLGLFASGAHPMHTAVTELAQQDAGGTTAVQIRVFADDFQAALPLPADPAAADSAIARYLRGTFALADRTGRPVRLAWAGAERSGDVILVRLEGRVTGGLAGARVTSLVLCERFEDEVNVVRAAYAGRTETLLFTRGESSKALP
jgi:uncharacterized protein DUF6702